MEIEKNISIISPSVTDIRITDLPQEVIGFIFKELFKSFIIGFMTNAAFVNAHAAFPIKNIRLINKSFKQQVDRNKRIFMKWALEELKILGAEAIHLPALPRLFIENLHQGYGIENIKRATLLLLLGFNPNLLIEQDENASDKGFSSDYLLIEMSKDDAIRGMVELVCGFGADIEIVSPEQGTPLMVATMHGQIEIIKTLLSKGADFNKKHKDYSALDIAQQQSSQHIIDLFLPPSCWQRFLRVLEGISDYMIAYHIS